MKKEATYSMLNDNEKSEYSDIINRYIRIVENMNKSAKKRFSIPRLMVTAFHSYYTQGFKLQYWFYQAKKLDKELDDFFDKIDAKYKTFTPHHSRSQFPSYEFIYIQRSEANVKNQWENMHFKWS
jgi:hypothetical protein